MKTEPTAPRLDPAQLARRNERICADVRAGRGVDWICKTYGVGKSSVYQITAGIEATEVSPLVATPLAEWEIDIRNAGFAPRGTKLRSDVPMPSREWVENLVDIDFQQGLAEDTLTSCVYFVQEEGEGGYVKIGLSTTATIRSRVGALRNANPRNLWLRRLVRGDVSTEARLHCYFGRFHIRGEWFTPGDELAEVGRLPTPSDDAA